MKSPSKTEEELSPEELAFHPSWHPIFRLQRRKKQIALTCRWAVGFADRGLGHGDFGVVLEEPCREWKKFLKDVEKTEMNDNHREWLTKPFVLECPDKDVAEHIVELHNERLGRH